MTWSVNESLISGSSFKTSPILLKEEADITIMTPAIEIIINENKIC